jgi:hypothetical protein
VSGASVTVAGFASVTTLLVLRVFHARLMVSVPLQSLLRFRMSSVGTLMPEVRWARPISIGIVGSTYTASARVDRLNPVVTLTGINLVITFNFSSGASVSLTVPVPVLPLV